MVTILSAVVGAQRAAPLEAPLKYGHELQLGIMQLEREGSPPPGLRLPQAKLSRKSNQVARGRICWFESTCPATQSFVQPGHIGDRSYLRHG